MMKKNAHSQRKDHEPFFWGVVNIGAQTEGNDRYGNWSAWARRGLVPHIGVANDYMHRYIGDHDAAEMLGCNSMRITIEWSRIEPQEGVFDHAAMRYYARVLYDLQNRNMKTVVGLWHWQIPLWCEERYGMHHRDIVQKFEKFARYVCMHVGHLIDYIVVINEPMVFVQLSYMRGTRPPFFKNHILQAHHVVKNLVAIHKCVYTLWKEKYPHTKIGSTHLWNDERGLHGTMVQKTYLSVKKFFSSGYFIKALLPYSDYIGINYYTSDQFFFGKSGGRWGVHGTNDWHSADVWRSFPEGLYHVLMGAKKYQKPLLILENGKPTNAGIHDVDRQEFLMKTILYMQKAIAHGVDVRGYFHYCLCDSYEWDSGYDFKFGLMEIDRTTGERRCRDSFFTYRDLIREWRV